MKTKLSKFLRDVQKYRNQSPGRSITRWPDEIRKTACHLIKQGEAIKTLSVASGIREITLSTWMGGDKLKPDKKAFTEVIVKSRKTQLMVSARSQNEIRILTAQGNEIYLPIEAVQEFLERGKI